jgi:hypothetical protein
MRVAMVGWIVFCFLISVCVRNEKVLLIRENSMALREEAEDRQWPDGRATHNVAPGRDWADWACLEFMQLPSSLHSE